MFHEDWLRSYDNEGTSVKPGRCYFYWEVCKRLHSFTVCMSKFQFFVLFLMMVSWIIRISRWGEITGLVFGSWQNKVSPRLCVKTARPSWNTTSLPRFKYTKALSVSEWCNEESTSAWMCLEGSSSCVWGELKCLFCGIKSLSKASFPLLSRSSAASLTSWPPLSLLPALPP